MIETRPGSVTEWGITFPAGGCRIPSVPAHRQDLGVCAALAGAQLLHRRCSEATAEHTHKTVYTDSSHYLFLSLPLSWLFLWFAVLGGALNPPFYSAHQLISPPIYPSHNELLCLHHVPVLLHQPGGEAPARLETRGRGGEVGGKGRGLSGEETEEEERGDGGAGESPQLSWAAQWVSRHQTQWLCNLVGPNSSRGSLDTPWGVRGGLTDINAWYWPITDISVVAFMLILADLKTVLFFKRSQCKKNSAWMIYRHLIM